MIEIKCGSLAVEGKPLFKTLSFSVPNGSIVGMTVSEERYAKDVLECFLGLHRLDEGFVSIDGEPLLPRTKEFYRDTIAYLPRDVRMPEKRVADFFDRVISLSSNSEIEHPKKQLLEEWRRLGLSLALYDADMESVDDATLRLMMLGMIGVMRRNVIVLDAPTLGMEQQTTAVCVDYMKQLAHDGSAILVATHDERVLAACQDIVNIDINNVSSLAK